MGKKPGAPIGKGGSGGGSKKPSSGNNKGKEPEINKDKRIRNVLLVLIIIFSLALGVRSNPSNVDNSDIGVVDDSESKEVETDKSVVESRDETGDNTSKEKVEESLGDDIEDESEGVGDIEYRPIREGETPPSDELGVEVVYIDVGQADSTLIVTPSRKGILIDGGVKNSYEAISRELDAYNIVEIDLMIATHPHADHIGALEEVLKNYPVNEIMMSSYIATTKTFENLLLEIKSQGKSITVPKVGEVRNIDGLELEILGVDTIPNDNNSSSIVTKIEYAGNSVLFTGDLEADGEKKVVDEVAERLPSDIYHVGHHGSDTSSSEYFLDVVDPSISIISVGEGNKYKHPNPGVLDLLERYSDVYRTDRDGTIRTFLSPEGIWLDYDNRE